MYICNIYDIWYSLALLDSCFLANFAEEKNEQDWFMETLQCFPKNISRHKSRNSSFLETLSLANECRNKNPNMVCSYKQVAVK